MPIRPPALDDRSFDDLVEEVLARIPAHTPEWTNPRVGDPGRTLIDLFAWLTDTLLYRANLIPERQRLAFLRLLGAPLRPATPARGLVSVMIDDDAFTSAISLRSLAVIAKPVRFETRAEVTVLPVEAEAYYKRPLTQEEHDEMERVVPGLQTIYGLSSLPTPYVTTSVFAGGAPEPGGFDLVTRAVDSALWLALLAPQAPQPELQAGVVERVRQALGENPNGGQQLLSVGVMPAIEAPALFEDIGERARIPHVWEMSTLTPQGDPDYLTLEPIVEDDTTRGLTRRGVIPLKLPAASQIKVPSNDVRTNPKAGVGDSPPRLDAPEKTARLVAWIRLRPRDVSVQRLSLSWIGINAVEIDQQQTVVGRVIGQSDGSADQELQLVAQSVEPETLHVQVEEPGRGYQSWQRIDDLMVVDRDATAFCLDSEAGTIRFGDGLHGRIPDAGLRVRVGFMRAGGGRAGNLPAGLLTEIKAFDLRNNSVQTKLKVRQTLPTDGGEDAETLDAAERRIPALFRHRDRAVTSEDYKELAARAPGVQVGRVEILPRFLPHQRRLETPGVVSVMVLPFKPGAGLPNPRPDRPFLEAVHGYLDARRPLSTEMYAIGCEYMPLGISLGITVRDGFAPGGEIVGLGAGSNIIGGAFASGGSLNREGVVTAVREALQRYLWPLQPGGPDGTGWPLGRAIRDRELEVVVARVPGVSGVSRINLFERRNDDWRQIVRPTLDTPVSLALQPWQLPELLTLVVVVGEEPPEDLRGVPNPFADRSGVAVPVVPEKC